MHVALYCLQAGIDAGGDAEPDPSVASGGLSVTAMATPAPAMPATSAVDAGNTALQAAMSGPHPSSSTSHHIAKPAGQSAAGTDSPRFTSRASAVSCCSLLISSVRHSRTFP